MTADSKITREERKNLSSSQRLYRLYVIRAYKKWRKFNPLKPTNLLICYYYLQVAKIIYLLIVTRRIIVNTVSTLMQPGNILPLLFLTALITGVTGMVKLNLGG
jgi:hypothetical protein